MARQRVKLAEIKEALQKTLGFQSQAAKQLGISRQAISMRIKKNKSLQALLKDIDEHFLDIAELGLVKNLKEYDLKAIEYYLDRKGKDRGYGLKQEIKAQLGVDVAVRGGLLVVPASVDMMEWIKIARGKQKQLADDSQKDKGE